MRQNGNITVYGRKKNWEGGNYEDGFEDYEVWGLESITLPLRVENASAENGKSGAEPVAHGSGQPLSHKSQHAPFWVRSVLWDNKKFTRF